MDTETPTPTETSTPTETPTPTATFTPTLNYYIEVTVEPGEGARVVREVSMGDYTVAVLLFAILVSIWLIYMAERLKGGR